ncbi:ATP-binding protein [Natronococcus pandeyae]|uniref:ATP-binding protein n=1 Tax=Natronococcus pandeyae TaxID=2055836 RepID=UPI001F3E84B8|nr:ATP-binding protein [Natronococcus pandeyae]
MSTQDAENDDAIGIEWTVEDCTPGVDAFGPRPERLDTVFVVATPETLDSVAKYEQVARRHGVDCFLVVNRFQESAKDQLRAFDGPEIAEYIYVDEEISTAISDRRVPTLPDWTVEAILIEALQPERQEAERALAALDSGERSIVNVEVGDRADADTLIDSFKTAGYGAAYFECNCQCHDGHVLARQPQI